MSLFLGTPGIVTGILGAVHTKAMQPMGTRLNDNEGNVYIYLKGIANTIEGSWVAYDEDYLSVLLDDTEAAKLFSIAVASAAIVADRWGWYMIAGKGTVGAVLDDCAKEKLLYAQSTAGYLDDAADGNPIIGAMVTTSITGAATTTDILINYPRSVA